MPSKPRIQNLSPELRQRAERATTKESVKQVPPRTEFDAQRLLHELEVHQIELEMQNAELRIARNDIEQLLEKYTDLYDFAPVSYFTLAASGIIRLVNLTGATLVGTERSRLIGKSFDLLVSPSARPAFNTFLEQVLTNHTKQSIDSHLLQKKGDLLRPISIEARCSPNGDECRIAIMDITARTHAEMALRESEEFNRSITESSPDCITILDLAGNLLLFVHGAHEFLGNDTTEPYLDRPWLDFWSGEDRQAAHIAITAALTADKGNFVGYIKNLNCEPKWWDVRVSPILNADGRVMRILIVSRDITERKQSELIQRRNEVLFAALIEQAPVGVYVLDAAFRLQQANPTAQKLFSGIHPLIGRDFFEIVHLLWSKRVATGVISKFRKTMKTGILYQSAEFTHERRDARQEEIYEWQIQRVTLPAGEYGVVCFFTDITARKKAEAAQRNFDVLTASNLKLTQEIVQRQKLEEALYETREEQTRLLIQSRLQEIQMRDLSHQTIHLQENERKRISRELHDVIAQTLVGINVSVASLYHGAAGNVVEFQQRIEHTRTLVEKSVEVVHRFARELRPTMLDDLGLIPALQTFMKGFMEETGIRVSLKIFAGIEKSDDTVRTSLYRIAQEALSNVNRHANASHAEVSITDLGDTIRMQITDDGKGFQIDETLGTNKQKRLGLIGMRERAEMIGGAFDIQSSVGQGTSVQIEIPIGPTHRRISSKKKSLTHNSVESS